MKLYVKVLSLFLCLGSLALSAAEEAPFGPPGPAEAIRTFGTPLSYKQWKRAEVTEARNHAARIANKIRLLDAKYVVHEEVPSSKKILKDQLKAARENVEMARELTLGDYAEVYLSQLSARPAALYQLAKNMSAKENAQLLHFLIHRNDPDIDSKSLRILTDLGQKPSEKDSTRKLKN